MICILYANFDSPQWNQLFKAKSLKGHTIVVNPNDGPFIRRKSDCAGWQKITEKIRDREGVVAAYIDTVVAKWNKEEKEWDFHESYKNYIKLSDEIRLADGIMSPDMYFLDDFPSSKPLDENRKGLARICREHSNKIIANPGVAAGKAIRDKFPAKIYIEWERDGISNSGAKGGIFLGVKDKKLVVPGEYLYYHNKKDGKNPYETLSPYFEQML